MSWFRRLFRIGKAEAHAALDHLEDPIKMTEQGIRDLRSNLEKALVSLAEVKAMGIRAKTDVVNYEGKAKEYEDKAVKLLTMAKDGDMDQAEADRLAGEALLKKTQNDNLALQAKKNQEYFEANAEKLSGNIDGLKENISKYENELKTLKARATVSSASRKINQDLANVDSSSTVAMLEKMKEKVAQEEALAESYADIAQEGRSIDDEIDKALEGAEPEVKAKDELAALKQKMGI